MLDEHGRPMKVELQRRPLALLALLALARSTGIRRHRLFALLWPESDEAKASASLRQALYQLRHQLGAEVIDGVSDLRLNAEHSAVDVADFERATAGADHRRAIELYKGPFLEGFHLSGALEFEDWSAAERARLARVFATTIERSAAEALARGDESEAATLWHLLLGYDPLNSRVVEGYSSALAAAGDRSSALGSILVHERLLRVEYGVDLPGPLLGLRASLTRPPVFAAYTAQSIPQAIPHTRPFATADVDATLGRDEVRSAGADVRRPRAERRWAIGAAVAVAGLLAVAWATPYRRALQHQPGTDRSVVILPFASDAAPPDAYLAEGATHLLAVSLEGIDGQHVIAPEAVRNRFESVRLADTPEATMKRMDSDTLRALDIARHFGAVRFIVGGAVVSGGRIRLHAALYSRSPDAHLLARAEAEGLVADFFTVVDRLAVGLIAIDHPGSGGRVARDAGSTTTSLPAYKSFLTGEAEMRARHYAGAVRAYTDAVTIDSTFALAFYRLSIAADWLPNNRLMKEAADQALAHSRLLADHDRLMIEGLRAARFDLSDDAERAFLEVTRRWPDDPEAWTQLAELLFHGNATRSRSFTEAEGPFRQAQALDPTNHDIRLHLARLAGWRRDTPAVDTLLAPIIAAMPDTQSLELRLFLAAVQRREVLVDTLVGRYRDRDDVAVFNACTRVAIYGRRLDVGEKLAALLTEPSRARDARAVGSYLLASLATARGQPRRAAAALASMRSIARPWALEVGGSFALFPLNPDSAAAPAIAARDSLRALDAPRAEREDGRGYRWFSRTHVPTRDALLSLLDSQLGAGPEPRAQRLFLPASLDSTALLRRHLRDVVDAAQFIQRGNSRAAANLLDRHTSDVERTGGGSFIDPMARYLTGIALARSGAGEKALPWLGSFDSQVVVDLPWAAPGHYERARILESLNRPAEAAAEYGEVVALWGDGEPVYRRIAARARLQMRSAGAR